MTVAPLPDEKTFLLAVILLRCLLLLAARLVICRRFIGHPRCLQHAAANRHGQIDLSGNTHWIAFAFGEGEERRIDAERIEGEPMAAEFIHGVGRRARDCVGPQSAGEDADAGNVIAARRALRIDAAHLNCMRRAVERRVEQFKPQAIA